MRPDWRAECFSGEGGGSRRGSRLGVRSAVSFIYFAVSLFRLPEDCDLAAGLGLLDGRRDPGDLHAFSWAETQ